MSSKRSGCACWPGRPLSCAIMSTSSTTMVAGARSRTNWPMRPIQPIDGPLMRMTVRPVMRPARYMTVSVFPVPGHDLDAQAYARSHLEIRRSADVHAVALRPVAHDEQPELHARDDAVALELEVRVVDRPFGKTAPGSGRGEQVGQGHLAPAFVLHRDADEVDRAAALRSEQRVEGDLDVRVLVGP